MTYEEYLAAVREQEQRDRERFSTTGHDIPPAAVAPQITMQITWGFNTYSTRESMQRQAEFIERYLSELRVAFSEPVS